MTLLKPHFGVILAATLLFSGAGIAKDVAVYRHPTAPLSAVVTDEPCSGKVAQMLVQQGAKPEDVKKLLKAKTSKSDRKVEACVMPKDEDGDYYIFDAEGDRGYLLHDNITPVGKTKSKGKVDI